MSPVMSRSPSACAASPRPSAPPPVGGAGRLTAVMSRPLLQILLPALVGALMVLAWYYFYFAITPDNRFLLPRPDEIITAFLANRHDLLRAAINTTEGALLGF